LGQVIFLHLNYLWDVIWCWKNTWKLSLINYVVNGLWTHRVKEADCCVVIVHVGDMGSEPLVSIFWPNSNKTPLFAITFSLSNETQFLHTASEILTNFFNLSKGFPFVISKIFFIQLKIACKYNNSQYVSNMNFIFLLN
jgi:hypothetical protein